MFLIFGSFHKLIVNAHYGGLQYRVLDSVAACGESPAVLRKLRNLSLYDLDVVQLLLEERKFVR
ncbi:MAG: hypothetical protein IJ894_14245, partial [Bacteroidales bacterium]|nr:hypothetical protein [Bacteroidales bacterium]